MLVDDLVFFFFQAEDGIRDYKVTGVQTCALPISPITRRRACGTMASSTLPTRAACWRWRSEERRVGKSVDLGGRRIIKKKKKRMSSRSIRLSRSKSK